MGIFHYLIFAENAVAARRCAQEKGIPYHMYSYVMSTDILHRCDPFLTQIVFDETWHNHDKSAELFTVAFNRGLISRESLV